MKKKIFDPAKYGMAPCPFCFGLGYIQNPNCQCCARCGGGFGYVIKEAKKDANIPSVQGIRGEIDFSSLKSNDEGGKEK